MSRKDEIRVYNEKEDIIADYDNFRKDWEYDREGMSGMHKSGLKVSKVVLDKIRLKYSNIDEWRNKMKAEGLSETETEDYRRMVKNQFIVISEKEPYQEKELTLEEKMANMEKDDKNRVEMLKKDLNWSDEQTKKYEEQLRKNREEFYNRGGRWW